MGTLNLFNLELGPFRTRYAECLSEFIHLPANVSALSSTSQHSTQIFTSLDLACTSSYRLFRVKSNLLLVDNHLEASSLLAESSSSFATVLSYCIVGTNNHFP